MSEKLFTKVSVRKVRTIFKILYNTVSLSTFTLSIIFPDDKEVVAKLGSIKDLETLKRLIDETLKEVTQ